MRTCQTEFSFAFASNSLADKNFEHLTGLQDLSQPPPPSSTNQAFRNQQHQRNTVRRWTRTRSLTSRVHVDAFSAIQRHLTKKKCSTAIKHQMTLARPNKDARIYHHKGFVSILETFPWTQDCAFLSSFTSAPRHRHLMTPFHSRKSA